MNEAKFKVTEIFESIEGEGIRTGYPVTFVRLHGCNLNCSYCDSQYSCVGDDYTEMTLKEIFDKVYFLNHGRVTLTGGEPLVHKDVELLITALSEHFEVNVETNGSVDLAEWIEKYPLVTYTMDWKSPSSGMNNRMIEHNLGLLRNTDVLKFVVGTQEDLFDMLEVVEYSKPAANIFVSPVFGAIQPREIVEFLLKYTVNNIRLQLQLHKLVWDPMKRGV